MKAPRKHVPGTLELWVAYQTSGFHNFIIVKEDGKTEFMFTHGKWNTMDMDRRKFIFNNVWGTPFKLAGIMR